MRLLVVHRINYRKGGAEGVFLDHLQLFRDMGWECAEFTMAHPDNLPSPWERYFPPYFEAGEGGLVEQLAQVPRFLHSREAAERFAQLIADFKPDVIHMHGLYQQLTASVMAPAKASGAPIVFTLHDFKLICPNYYFYNSHDGVCERCKGGRQWNVLLRRCSGVSVGKDAMLALDGLVQWYGGAVRKGVDAFVCPSRFLQAKMSEHGFDPARLAYVPNFFETADDAPVDPSAVADIEARYGRFALYFGRLSREKGLDVLIEAARIGRFRLVIVGDGPQRAELEARVRAEAIDAHFLGFKRGADLWAHVAAAAVIALPSIAYENAPKALLEAQARGKIVVTSAIGGLPELIVDGETGYLARPADASDVAEKIGAALALSPQTTAVMGDRARVRVTADFTRQRYYRDMVRLYEELVARRR
ncbi:MAG: glycosyltransferase family 4 protein [Ancalomicrobiaceae bacterium]|nr:glycosyltransferase family 4 protein [Ancalomicrobiaceae bacterium]